MSSRYCDIVKARTVTGKEGLVPENYIRVWNPVDDVGDDDMNEVNVDDDIPLSDHALTPSDNYKHINHSNSEFVVWHFCVLRISYLQLSTIYIPVIVLIKH